MLQRTKDILGAGIGVFLIVAMIVIGVGGYTLNVVKLLQCDFEAPYKAEVIRIVGVPFAPVGIIAGWMDLGK